MRQLLALILLVLLPLVSIAADLKVGDKVFLRPDAQTTIDGKQVDIKTIPIPATILEIKDEMVLLGKTWVRFTDMMTADEALVFYNEQLTDEPASAIAYSNRGFSWKEKHEFQHMFDDSIGLFRLNPNNAIAYSNRGNAGQENEALQFYNEQLADEPASAIAYSNRGFSWKEKHEFQHVFDDLTGLITLNPNNANGYSDRGGTERAEEALEFYNEQLANEPASAIAYSNRGFSWKVKHEFQHMFDELTGLARHNPNHANACFHCGNNEVPKADHDNAENDDAKSIEVDRARAWRYANCGLAWQRKGELDKALIEFNKAIRLNPTDGQAYSYRAGIWRDKGEAENAVKDCTEAIRLDPTQAFNYVSRGYNFLTMGKFDEAINDHSKAISLDRLDAIAYMYRGYARQVKGEFDKALDDYADSIRLNPSNAETYYYRATIWESKSEFDKAIVDYSEVIRLNPSNAGAFAGRGTDWGAKGEFDTAIKDFTEAIRLDPKLALAYCNIAWLRAACPEERFRDGKEAIEFANIACEMTEWKNPNCISSLAAAYAETSEFTSAVKWQERAIELMNEQEKQDAAELLKLYQANKPYRFTLKKLSMLQFL